MRLCPGGCRHQRLHIPDVADIDAREADLVGGPRMIGVQPHFIGHVRDGVETRSSLRETEGRALVGIGRRADPHDFPPRPVPSPEHVAVNSPGVWVFAGVPHVRRVLPMAQVFRGVDLLELVTGPAPGRGRFFIIGLQVIIPVENACACGLSDSFSAHVPSRIPGSSL